MNSIFEHIQTFCTDFTGGDMVCSIEHINTTIILLIDLQTYTILKARFQQYCQSKGFSAVNAGRALKRLMFLCRCSAAASAIITLTHILPSSTRASFCPVNFSDKSSLRPDNTSIVQSLRKLFVHSESQYPRQIMAEMHSMSGRVEKKFAKCRIKPLHVHKTSD